MPSLFDRAVHHPTKEKLIATVVAMLEGHPGPIGVEEVLRASKISAGSLYHHFEDFDDLLETSYARRFSRLVDASIVMIDSLLSEVSSKKEMKAALSAITRATQSPDLAPVRFERARIVAMAEGNERFRAKLSVEQERLTAALADLFSRMKSAGWMSTGVDPRAGAVFIQAYTLGKVVDDVVDEPVDEDRWNAMIDGIIDRYFAG